VENVTSGSGGDSLVGNGSNNVLIGGGSSDRIDGGGGDDTIQGGDGDDVLLGGSGSDSITGGDGNDLLYDNTTSATDGVTDFLDGEGNGGPGDTLGLADAGDTTLNFEH